MRTAKEIRAEIRELRKEMKEAGISVTSFMNRTDDQTYRCNAKLFALKVELEDAIKREAK